MEISEFLPGIQKNISLKNYTTFKIGGPAKYFFEARTKEDLIKAIKMAKKFNLPFFILGGGSNILVSDRGYEGMIIKVKSQKSKIKSTSQKSKIIEAEAGISLGQLVNLALKNNLTGFEWAVGVPGTLGGAIYGNAGWPSDKKNISAIIKEVEVLDISREPKIKKFNKSACQFKYRDSVFKHNKNLIILGAFLQLKKGDKIKIKKEIAEIIKKRKDKIPIEPSAGCIFKNPAPEQARYGAGPLEFSAGELIDKCGLKGKKIGKAQISEKHANFIVNLGGAKSEDVIKLIKLVKQKVKNKFAIWLEEEIQFLG